jgi:hypothetical protein
MIAYKGFQRAKDAIPRSPNQITVVYHLVKNSERVLLNIEMNKKDDGPGCYTRSDVTALLR